MTSSILDLAREGATRSQANYLQRTVGELNRSQRQVQRTTYQGVEPTTGRLFRRSLSGGQSVADGLKVFNRRVLIGDPVLAIPTGDRTRLLAKYQQPPTDSQGDRVLRKASIIPRPQAVSWMEMSATLDSQLFDLPFSFIEGYPEYVGLPFETPANFTQIVANRNFSDQGQQLVIGTTGGISQTIGGSLSTSDSAFSANYSNRSVAFRCQIFRQSAGSLNIDVTIIQDDGVGGTSAETNVSILGNTGLRQPNGLYLIEVTEAIFPAGVLSINNVAKNFSVSLEYA